MRVIGARTMRWERVCEGVSANGVRKGFEEDIVGNKVNGTSDVEFG